MNNTDKDYNLPSKSGNSELILKNEHSLKKDLKLRHNFKLERGCWGVRSVNVTTDNRYLIITNLKNPKIRVVDLEKLEYLPYTFSGHKSTVRLTSISSDNKSFFTASWDGTYRKFHIASGECTQILSGLGRSPSCFLDPKQKYLFTTSYDFDFDPESKNSGRCWDLSTGKIIGLYKHTNERKNPESIDIAYDQKFVYTGSDDGLALKWKLLGKKPILNFFQCAGSIRKVILSNNYCAFACGDGFARVHKKSGEYYRYFLHSGAEVLDVRISQDETKLYSASNDGSVKCFNLINGELIFHKKIHSSWIWSICLFNNDNMLVTGSSDGSVAIISATGELLLQFLNVPCNEFLITSPPDKVFQNGFFYTTNLDFIDVFSVDENLQILEKLDSNDLHRQSYIAKHNCKNLIITRLKNNNKYHSLTDRFLKNQELLNKLKHQSLPRALSAGLIKVTENM